MAKSNGFRSGELGGQNMDGQKSDKCSLSQDCTLWLVWAGSAVLLPNIFAIWGIGLKPWPHDILEHIQVHVGVDHETDVKEVGWHLLPITGNNSKNHDTPRCFVHCTGTGTASAPTGPTRRSLR